MRLGPFWVSTSTRRRRPRRPARQASTRRLPGAWPGGAGMTDRQDNAQQPPPGPGQQYWQGQTRPLPHDPGNPWAASAPQPGYGPPPGPGQQAPGQWYPPSPPGYGPPYGPPRKKPWAARHKVLTGFLACFGLLLVIGLATSAGSSSSSSTKVNATSSPVSATSGPGAAAGVAASPTVKKTAPAGHTVTAAPSAPARTTPPAHSATTPAAQSAAPSTPAPTAPASVPAPPASTAPAGCHPLTNGGKCYEPGEFRRASDHGASGLAGDGEAIVCENNDGWRWEPV